MVQLFNANCMDILPEIIANVQNPIIVTDPPFNIGYKYRSYADNLTDKDYYAMLKNVCSFCPSVVIHYPEALYRLAIEMGQVPTKVVSWVYNSNTPRQHRDIAFFACKPDFSKVRQPYKNPKDKRIQERIANGCLGGKLYDWWNINQVKNVSKDKTAHPCQMPIEVMQNIVKILPDDVTIIDPFMGSGTTGAACAIAGKSFVGIESDNEYYNIAKVRIHSFLTPNGSPNLITAKQISQGKEKQCEF